MVRALVLGVAAVAISASSASANGYHHRHHYGFHYGYAGPVVDYMGGAYYGFPAPSYIHSPWPIWGGYWGDYYGYGRF